MHSYNDETGILEVLEIKIFFAAQAWLEEVFENPFRGFCNSMVVCL